MIADVVAINTINATLPLEPPHSTSRKQTYHGSERSHHRRHLANRLSTPPSPKPPTSLQPPHNYNQNFLQNGNPNFYSIFHLRDSSSSGAVASY
jgi:hypothetical protein